jgi:hypothetical protein
MHTYLFFTKRHFALSCGKPLKTMTDLRRVANTCTRAAPAMFTVKMEKHAESGGCLVLVHHLAPSGVNDYNEGIGILLVTFMRIPTSLWEDVIR